MTDRSFFSDDEWAALVEAPLHVTTAVVAVAEHGPISVLKEASASARVLTHPGDRGAATALIAAIAQDARGHDARHAAKGDRGGSPQEVVDHAVSALAPAAAAMGRLPVDEQVELRSWLIDLAQAVASAAKGTNAGEVSTLERIRVALGAPPAAG
jgi:hypothetical protein